MTGPAPEAPLASPPKRPPVPPQSHLARHGELLRELTRRELAARYRGSFFGVVWALLSPLAFLLLYAAVFSRYIQIAPTGVPYLVYLMSGLLMWNFVSTAIVVAGGCVVANSVLVTRVPFARILLPTSSLVVSVIHYMISLVLLVPFLLYYKISPGPPLILLPTLVMVVAGLCFGFGCFVAATNVYFRDVQHLIGIVLQMGFFMTPIIYPLSAVATSRLSGAGPILKALVYANPFTWVATSLQDIIAYRRWPHHGVGLGYSAAIALALTLTGAWYFQRAQRRFAEEL